MDDKTIGLFTKGSKSAFEMLFKSLYPVMCLFATKFIPDADDAEDIVQEMFIVLWKERVRFGTIDQVKAFLYLSIKNKCLNFSKHLKIKEKYIFTQPLSHEPSFEETIIGAEVILNIHRAIQDLPEQQKQVILKILEGLTNEEISEIMQISINTVKFHKKAAYQSLRERLSDTAFLLLFL